MTRAIIWAVATIAPAVLWAHLSGPLDRLWAAANFKSFYAGLYSEALFKEHEAEWFDSLASVGWLNYAILWRTYAVTVLISFGLTFATHRYSVLRRSLRNWPWLRAALASLVLPRIAPWHLLLSRILLDGDHLSIHLDVMTKSNDLYQGRLADKVLAGDGTLQSITLAEPKRFRREEYMHHKLKGEIPDSAQFWKRIPTNMFLIVGSEVETINFRYVPDTFAGLRRSRTPDDLQKVLDALSIAVKAAQATKSSARKTAIGESVPVQDASSKTSDFGN